MTLGKDKILEMFFKHTQEVESCSDVVFQEELLQYLDLSKYDLDNITFVDSVIEYCNLKNVYLSGSNFGGSVFKFCNFENNILVKGIWEGIEWRCSEINHLFNFRTEMSENEMYQTSVRDSVFAHFGFL